MSLVMTSASTGPAQIDPADWPPDLLCVADLPCAVLEATLDLAAEMKRGPSAWRDALAGEALACFFDVPAPGASASVGTAAHRLGMLPVVLARDELEAGDGGPLADVAPRYAPIPAPLHVHPAPHRTLPPGAAAAAVPP